MDESPIAVLGEPSAVLAFRAMGLRVCPVQTPQDARAALHRLVREGCEIIYLTEDLAGPLAGDVARYKDQPTPAIVLIPGPGGSLGLGAAALKRSVERAVGADIL